MGDVRSGNMLVKNMRIEIIEDLNRLKRLYLSQRVQRQLMDGASFLDMISKPPYNNKRTVSDLKKKISSERNLLKEKLVSMNQYMEGHQFTMFEQVNETTIKEQKQLEKESERVKNQIHWLHKCLGMCSDRGYFI